MKWNNNNNTIKAKVIAANKATSQVTKRIVSARKTK